MKSLILAAALAAVALPAYAFDFQVPAPTKQEIACTKGHVIEAFHGDFSNWVLPDFIPGKHRHVKDGLAPCMPATANPWR